MYGIYLHETNIKESRLLQRFSNKLEALGYLEEIVEDYISEKDGKERSKENLIREPSSYKSMRWGSIPYGYFKTRNTDESLYKITVWRKIKLEGYIYTSYEVAKIFSIDLIYLPTKMIEPQLSISEFLDDMDVTSLFKEPENLEKQYEDHKNLMNSVLPLIREIAEEAPETPDPLTESPVSLRKSV